MTTFFWPLAYAGLDWKRKAVVGCHENGRVTFADLRQSGRSARSYKLHKQQVLHVDVHPVRVRRWHPLYC